MTSTSVLLAVGLYLWISFFFVVGPPWREDPPFSSEDERHAYWVKRTLIGLLWPIAGLFRVLAVSAIFLRGAVRYWSHGDKEARR